MTLSQIINRPITILRATGSLTEDEYGNEIPERVPVETVGELQQKSRDEHDDQGETSDTHWLLFLLPGEALSTADVVTVDGEEYELVGEPWKARDPLGEGMDHVEATLRRTTGAADEVGS